MEKGATDVERSCDVMTIKIDWHVYIFFEHGAPLCGRSARNGALLTMKSRVLEAASACGRLRKVVNVEF